MACDHSQQSAPLPIGLSGKADSHWAGASRTQAKTAALAL
jgi:hypothetical protein